MFSIIVAVLFVIKITLSCLTLHYTNYRGHGELQVGSPALQFWRISRYIVKSSRAYERCIVLGPKGFWGLVGSCYAR